jgi:4'-phosphopantetheinyl transferase EntD
LNFASGKNDCGKITVNFQIMPIFFQQDIDDDTRLGIWKIEEDEDFFLKSVVLQRNVSHPHKKLQHLAGRYLLKYLFPDFPLFLILIADTRKPYLENEAYHFSISHCGDFAAAIVSKTKRVGVDIEIPTEKIIRISHKFLNQQETIMLNQWNGFDTEELSTLFGRQRKLCSNGGEMVM